MGKVQIGIYAKRNEDGSFGVAHPIYQEVEAREGESKPSPPYEDVAEMFYKIMKNAKARKNNERIHV